MRLTVKRRERQINDGLFLQHTLAILVAQAFAGGKDFPQTPPTVNLSDAIAAASAPSAPEEPKPLDPQAVRSILPGTANFSQPKITPKPVPVKKAGDPK